jgi:hypothetical protein
MEFHGILFYTHFSSYYNRLFRANNAAPCPYAYNNPLNFEAKLLTPKYELTILKNWIYARA